MDSNKGGAATINATSIDVQSGGFLKAEGLGFPMLQGPGTGTGGAYGGRGGSNNSADYGSMIDPRNLGSGGQDNGGGGAGGYSGGAAGCDGGNGYGGGGGGSYNSGINQQNTAGANNNHGRVEITLLSSAEKEVPYALSTLNGGQFQIRGITLDSSTNVNDNNLHHLVASYDGSNMKIYVDGSLENSGSGYTGLLPSNEDPVWIGRHFLPSETSNFFNGEIDKVMLYNRALSDGEVLSIYNTQKP